jgi:tRNA (uracil-5-)-methyltransferase
LYQRVIDRVREVATVPAQTLLFDVCCGTGTIGISCLKAGVVSRVIGVDISVPAIRDAERNASLNGFVGEHDDSERTGELDRGIARFVASRAEEVLGKEISKARDGFPGMEFVAVVDPAREGLHADVCKTLRSNSRIRRIVYVSCNPTGTLVRDAALLCAPPTKRYSGRPFKITSATPVDMFPLTTVRLAWHVFCPRFITDTDSRQFIESSLCLPAL